MRPLASSTCCCRDVHVGSRLFEYDGSLCAGSGAPMCVCVVWRAAMRERMSFDTCGAAARAGRLVWPRRCLYPVPYRRLAGIAENVLIICLLTACAININRAIVSQRSSPRRAAPLRAGGIVNEHQARTRRRAARPVAAARRPPPRKPATQRRPEGPDRHPGRVARCRLPTQLPACWLSPPGAYHALAPHFLYASPPSAFLRLS